MRVALRSLQVVHSGDLFPLPLPPHPITHVPAETRAKCVLCEPVAQGILSSATKIIVSRGRIHSKHGRETSVIQSRRHLNGLNDDGDDTANDTANDQFYSAAEERARTETGHGDRRLYRRCHRVGGRAIFQPTRTSSRTIPWTT